MALSRNSGESYAMLGWAAQPVITVEKKKTMIYILCTIRQTVTKVRRDEKLCLGSTLLSQNPIWQAVSSIWQLCIVVKERITHSECKPRCSVFVTKPSREHQFFFFFTFFSALTVLLSFTRQHSQHLRLLSMNKDKQHLP